MDEQIEIEFKALLTKKQFALLEKELPFPKQPIIQTNHYFDTKDFLLRDKRCSVRLREINSEFTFTLKQSKVNHVLESNKNIEFNDAEAWLKGNYRELDDIEKVLESVGLNGYDLVYYGSLTTKRRQFPEEQMIYFLDKSTYNGVIDYELEIEAPTYEQGESAFHNTLEKYNITPTRPITKIERFFRSIRS